MCTDFIGIKHCINSSAVYLRFLSLVSLTFFKFDILKESFGVAFNASQILVSAEFDAVPKICFTCATTIYFLIPTYCYYLVFHLYRYNRLSEKPLHMTKCFLS